MSAGWIYPAPTWRGMLVDDYACSAACNGGFAVPAGLTDTV